MLNRNLGTTDRALRMALGAALVAAGLLTPEGPWRALAVVGAVLLLTATVRFCPLYRVLGLRTCTRAAAADARPAA